MFSDFIIKYNLYINQKKSFSYIHFQDKIIFFFLEKFLFHSKIFIINSNFNQNFENFISFFFYSIQF